MGGVIRNVGASLHRTSGTAKNGTWKGTALIPKWTNNGTWTITGINLIDAGGGQTTYTPTGTFGSKPFPSGWPKSFKVTSKPDTVGPTFTSIKWSPGSVNTSSKAKTIAVTVQAKDALSGVSGFIFANASVQIGTYPNVKYFQASGGLLKRHGGTSHNGTYKGTLTVPRWVTSGTKKWTLNVSAGDLAGNPAQKNPAGTFKVTSKTDATKPALKGLTFTPHSVNSTNAPKGKTVSVTLKASDTLSGLSYAYATFTSPGGYRVSGFAFPNGHPTSATLKFKVIIPRCSESGIWTANVTIVDVAQNQGQFTPAQIKAKHFTSTLSVKALDWQAPGGTVPATVSHTGSVVVTLSEPTLWSGSGSPNPFTVYDAATFNTVNGTWTCKSAAGAVLRQLLTVPRPSRLRASSRRATSRPATSTPCSRTAGSTTRPATGPPSSTGRSRQRDGGLGLSSADRQGGSVHVTGPP